MRIDVIHGPNLDRLGRRETSIYGAVTLAQIDDALVRRGTRLGVHVHATQSAHEGALVERIHAAADAGSSGVVINPAAYTHTSVALRDALLAVELPFIEVHLSNVYAREPFRHVSLLRDKALGVLCGLGPHGYLVALDAIVRHLRGTTDDLGA